MSDFRINLQLGIDRKRRLSQMAEFERISPSDWLRRAVDTAWEGYLPQKERQDRLHATLRGFGFKIVGEDSIPPRRS